MMIETLGSMVMQHESRGSRILAIVFAWELFELYFSIYYFVLFAPLFLVLY